MISRVYYQQLGDSEKLCYNSIIERREKAKVKTKKKQKSEKKLLTGFFKYVKITE